MGAKMTKPAIVIIIILLVLFLGALGFIGYMQYQTYQQGKQTEQQQEQYLIAQQSAQYGYVYAVGSLSGSSLMSACSCNF